MKFTDSNGRELPKHDRIKLGNIGTPNGIIPHKINHTAKWGLFIEGDGKFYVDLSKRTKVQFIKEFI